MNERRMSLGNRILSLVLALVMVFGMLPSGIFAFTAKAADSATATNVAAIRQYAANLLNSNFSKAASEDSSTDSDSFTWDTEGQETNWRYFNGVMLQALLMLGMDSSAGNALEFAKDFMDTNTADATKAVTHYITNEADSVPPALAIFDLLETAEVSEADRDIYKKAVNYVYKQLEAQVKYDGSNGLMDCGGNLLHKQTGGVPTSSWDAYEIGLDGIYMAQPFYMEYAHALENGLITNTVNTKTANQIYAEVYERLMWVADNMYDETTGLYNHGYGTGHKGKGNDGDGDTTTGVNGQFWGRGIGWYAVGLVECIELMPAGPMKNDLIANLKKLFDGMLPYQDTANAVDAINTDNNYTGMWYNIVNTSAKVKDSNNNRPETSVSGLMSYALLKAYNEGWVTDAKYATAGLAAFNGIVTNKLVTEDGQVVLKDIYKQSGVGTTQEYYCTYAYTSNEAKGVGGVLMAAAEAERYIGTAETFTVGVVSAPDIIVPLNTAPDYSDVKITLLGSQGTIRNVPVTDSNVTVQVVMAAADELTSAGEGTATVYYGSAPIGTFNIAVVDTESGETVNGTIAVGGNGTDPSTGTNDADSGTVTVASSDVNAGSYTYTEYTGAIANGEYLIVVLDSSGNAVILANNSGTAENKTAGKYTKAISNGIITLSEEEAKYSEWTFSSENATKELTTSSSETFTPSKYSITNAATTDYTYYLRGKSSSILTRKSGNITDLYIADDQRSVEGKGYEILLRVNNSNQWEDLTYTSNAWNRTSAAKNRVAFVKLYKETDAISSEDVDYTITLTAGSDGELMNKGDTKALTATLTAAAGQTSATPSGTVVWSSNNTSVATVDSSTGVVTAVAAGDATITATVTGATVSGSDNSVNLFVEIPVTVVEATTYNVSLTVTPVNMVMEKGNTTPFYAEVAVANGDTTLSGWSYSDMTVSDYSSVVTVAGNQVTGASAGSTTITVTLNSVTDGTNTYPLSTPITQNISVTVTESHIHSYTSQVTTAATCTAPGEVTYTCSGCEAGTEGHSYTEAIAALGHTAGDAVVEDAVDATCTEEGSCVKVVKCTVCGEEISRTNETVPATGHNYGAQGTCTNVNNGTLCGALKPTGNVTVTTGTTPSGTQFVVATELKEGQLYVIANAENTDRAAYWNDSDWRDGGDGVLTAPTGNSTVYTLNEGKHVNLWYWDAEKSSFYLSTDSSKYLNCDTGSGNNATLGDSNTTFTVDLTGKTIKIGSSSMYLKIESDGDLNAKSSGSTWLLTPVMTGGDETVHYQVEISAEKQTVEVGKTLAPVVTITVKDTDGNVVNTTATGTFEFTSGDPAKATVEDGKIKGVATGDVTITAKLTGVTIGGVTASIDEGATITTTFTVTVTEATVDPLTYYLVDEFEAGKEYVLVAVESGKVYVLKNTSTTSSDKETAVAYVITTYANDMSTITFDTAEAADLSEWTFVKNGDAFNAYNHKHYLRYDSSMLHDENNKATIKVTAIEGKSGQFHVSLANNSDLMGLKSGAWVRKDATVTTIYLYQNTNSSSGGTTPDPDEPDTPVVGSQYIHNFSEHGKTSDFYTITGNLVTSGSYKAKYNGEDLAGYLKMESSTSITFTATGEGTLTLVFDTETGASKTHTLKWTGPDGTTETLTVPNDGILTVNIADAGKYTLEKGSGASYLFYMAYAVAATDGIEIVGSDSLYIGGEDSDELTFNVLYGGQTIADGYELTVVSSNENAVKVENTNGKYSIVAVGPGVADITATLTKVGETEVTATLTDTLNVTVFAPSVTLEEDKALVAGQTYTFTPTVAYEDGSISDYTLTVNSDNKAVTATVNADGTITLVANKATEEGAPATITATLTKVGSNDVSTYSYTDTMQVEVAPLTIIKVDMVPDTITMSSAETLDDLLKYEEDVTLTFKYNDGSQIVVPANDLTIDNSTVAIGEVGTYSAMLTYKNDEMGVDYAKAITVKILDATQINAEGIASQVKVEYILDKDGTIEGDTKYLIVVGTDALMVPTNASGDNTGASNTVSIDGDKATVSNNYILTEWHFAGRGTDGDYQTFETVTNRDINNAIYYYLKSQENFVNDGSGNTIILETVDADAGEYKLHIKKNNYYLVYNDGSWSRTSDSAKATTIKLYKRTETPIKEHTVGFEVEGTGVACNLGVHTLPTALGVDLTKQFTGTVTLDGVSVDLSRCEIEWSVEESGADYLKVDSTGLVTGLKDSADTKYKVYAKLLSVDGMKVTARDNTAYLLETIEIEVAEVELVYQMFINGVAAGEIAETATGTMYLPLGENPDLNKVEIKVYQRVNGADTYVETYQLEDLIYNIADSTLNVENPGSEATITVKKRGNSAQIGTLTIKVGTNATQYREPAEKPYPGYPDEGAVRLDKIATGVGDFAETAIAKIELKVAGVSTSSPVDVVLIVDVSNSMGWDINRSSGSNDAAKIPENGPEGTDKLDNAMASATAFAEILLKNNETGKFNSNNTITFATFAGNDTDRAGSDSDCLDAMQTIFYGQDDLDAVKKSFSGTMFTGLDKLTDSDGKETGKVKYTLKLVDDKGNTIAEKENSGGTNYDYAFLQGKAAVEAVKDKWEAANPGKTYAESGRELHVIFMTDGIPSHYNGKYHNTGSQTSGFTKYSGSSWVTEVKNPNTNATALYEMVTDIHTVGFDLDAGGLGNTDDAKRLLAGLVENRKLECALAEETTALNDFFTELAESLAYAGTSAVAVDTVGNKFVLQTASFSDGTNTVEPTIEILSRRLVLRSDIGSTLLIIGENGTSSSVELTSENIEKYLGAYVDEEPEVLEKVEFNGDNVANSSLLDGDIWNEATDTITAQYFTYNTADKTFNWNIDDITDREVSLVYYGYLYGTGKHGEENTIENGTYPTNESATLKYVDTKGKIAESEFPVPYMPWGSALVTFRFYLVNPEGKFVNRANVTFDSPANRIFLTQRKSYELGLGATETYNAKDVLSAAGLAGESLYDPDMAVTLTTSGNNVTGSVAWDVTTTLANIGNLKIAQDLSGGEFSNVIVDIPVVLTGLGESDQKMADSSVVIDFSNSVQWDALVAEERAYDGFKYQNVQYTIELVGFAPYDPNVDLKDYLPETVKKYDTLTTEYGTYKMMSAVDDDPKNPTNGIDDVIQFTPNAMLNGTDHVLAVFKFANQDTTADTETKDYYYMYKLISVVPATVVHYETSGNMSGAFDFTAVTKTDGTKVEWENDELGTPSDAAQNINDGQYGYDASYNSCINYSGGSAMCIVNDDPANVRPSVTFSFTGTGIDIISRTGKEQGMIKLTVTGENTDTKKTAIVLNKGVDELYQLPVLSVEGLPYDTYKAEIIVYGQPKAYNGMAPAYGGTFCFDAILVYGASQETEVVSYKTVENSYVDVTVGDLYKEAGESAPQFFEVRDILLGNKNFGDISAAGVSGAVYIDGNATQGGDSTNFADYEKIGPNNEVYLSNNQAIAFKLKATDTAHLPATLAIGLKSVNTAVNASIIIVANGQQYNYSYSVATSTAMFYDLFGADKLTDFPTDANGITVVIANKGDGILSVTDLKVAYGSAAGKVDVIVDTGVAEDANAALAASARVESVEVTGDAYAMQTTTITVVTGQAARSVEIVDSNGNMVAVKASFADSQDGKRTWTILATFTNMREEKITVYGIGADGNRHATSATATVNVLAQNTTN